MDSLINSGDVVSIDADGVVFDFLAKWEDVMRLTLRRPVERVCESAWSLDVKYGLKPIELDSVWLAFNKMEAWRDIHALPGAAAWVNRLIDELNCKVHVVTAIDPSLREQRRQAFAQIGIDPDRLHMHCVGHVGTKLAAFMKIRPRVHIDDNIAHLTEAKCAGVPLRILVRGAFHEHADATHAVASLADIQVQPSRKTGLHRVF